MKIIKYNAICNLGSDIEEIFAKAIKGEAGKFEQRGFARLGVVDFPLPEISESDYNLRCNRLLLKALEPLCIEELDREKTAIVTATSNSGVDEYEISGNPKHYQIGNPAEFLHGHFGFRNFYTSVSTACSSGIKAFATAAELLEAGIAETVIVAGCDAISKVPVYGFHALEVLGNVPSNPFSKNRKWINIGEGAAAFVVKKEGNGIEVAGIGETTDFYHSTTPDPEAVEPERAIRLALGNLNPEEIDYINLHGTGTIANDLMEARAVYNVFGDKVPASSTKPLTGHCLGAAASIETALCCKIIQAGVSKTYPHIYDGEYDDRLPVIKLADKKPLHKPVKTCLCTSFGFGGTNCAIILRESY